MKLRSPKKCLPKSKNGTRRKSANLACYQYQKNELISRVAARNMSVSYYLNHLLWKEWL